jgi:MoxR-like ATPase
MQSIIQQLIQQLDQILLGKHHQIKLAISCLLAEGHLLLEDLPGMGKTTLAHGLAKALGLQFQRVQFTSDLLPADILGAAIFDREKSQFRFHPGPVFSNILLADEINRSSPKTQSALLEAMEERQVSIEGKTRALPSPFFVIATQNPFSQSGTFPLPESQLDRFLMRLSLGYPSATAERQLLEGLDPRERINQLQTLLKVDQLAELQQMAKQVTASPSLLDYLQRLVAVTRHDDRFGHGLSPRGALAILRAAKAWALIHDRQYLIPEDLQAVIPAVITHRLRGTTLDSHNEELARLLIEQVKVV